MELEYEISDENIGKLEIKEITLDKEKFGVLTFDKAYPLLDNLRKNFVELDDLNYKDKLTAEELQNIERFKVKLLDYISRIHKINPVDGSYNSNVRDQLESDIQNFYNNTAKELRIPLTFLRQEAAIISSDAQALADQQKIAAQAETEYKKLTEELHKELDELRKRKNEVSTTEGEIAAITLGKSFETQAKEYDTKAKKWKETRDIFFWILIVLITVNLVLYISLFITNKISVWPNTQPTDFFTIEYGLVKLALLALLSYAIGFATRNYNINSGLVATNLHRKNVAETLVNTLNSPIGEEAKKILTQQAAAAMFQNLAVGYIKKEHQNDAGPILEIIKKVTPD